MLASALSSYLLLKITNFCDFWEKYNFFTQLSGTIIYLVNLCTRQLCLVFSGRKKLGISVQIMEYANLLHAYILGYTPRLNSAFKERSNSWLYLHVRVLIGADFRSVGHFHTFLFHKRTINILLIDVLDHWLVVIAAQILRIQLNTFGYIWHLQITYVVVIIDPDPGFPPGTCGGLPGSVSNAVNHDYCSLAFENWSLNTTVVCRVCVVGVTV